MGSGKIDDRRGVTRCGHDGAQIRWPACGEFSDKGRREVIHGLEGPLNRDDGVRHYWSNSIQNAGSEEKAICARSKAYLVRWRDILA